MTYLPGKSSSSSCWDELTSITKKITAIKNVFLDMVRTEVVHY